MESKNKYGLEFFLSYINRNMNENDPYGLFSALNDYMQFLFPGKEYSANMDKIQEYNDYFIKDNDGLDKKSQLIELQQNLRDKVDRIIKAKGQKIQLVSLKGTSDLWCYPDQDKFEQKFEPNLGTGKNKPFDMEKEKQLADLAFASLIIENDLQPNRFKKCSVCQSYFYVYTKRKKIYCSHRCANVASQRSHQSKKKVDGKKNQS